MQGTGKDMSLQTEARRPATSEHENSSARQSIDGIDNIADVAVQTPKRSSSVHFNDSHHQDEDSMSRHRHSADTDEITPIRQADGNASRSYNTTEPDSSTRSTDSTKPATPAVSGQEIPKKKASWWKRTADKYGSVTLDNKGSVARDHLALERTFLAWLRTSLAFASIGIAITQLFRLNTSLQNKTRRHLPHSQDTSLLPLSPLVGHGLPEELIPFLQQLAYAAAQSLPAPAPTNTLLDQLLLMPSADVFGGSVHQAEFNQPAATKLRRVGKPLGATFIGISIVVLLVGFHRYFESQYWIIRGKFPASRGSVAFVGFIAGALIVASLVVVLVIAPVSYEK